LNFLSVTAIARHLNLRADAEACCPGAIMRDPGRAAPHDRAEGSCEAVGAGVAHDYLLAAGLEKEKADLVHEAIALHSAVGIAGRREPEIALVHFGAGIDGTGFRAEDIPAATRDAIVEAWPRPGCKRAFPPLPAAQVEGDPHCHIAGHYRLDVASKIGGAPFPE